MPRCGSRSTRHVRSDLGEGYPYRDQHETVERVCRELGIAFHDLLPVLADRDPVGLRAHVHDRHPNARCHAIAGRFLAEAVLARILEDR